MLDSIYHMTVQVLFIGVLSVQSLKLCQNISYFMHYVIIYKSKFALQTSYILNCFGNCIKRFVLKKKV